MKVNIFGYNEHINVDDGEVARLSINNNSLYVKTIRTLISKEVYDNENDLIFSEDEKRIKFDSVLFIDNILIYEFDNKKIITKLINNYFNNISFDQEKYYKLSDSINILFKDFNQYLQEYDFDYDFYEYQINQLLKTSNINFNVSSENLIVKLDNIIGVNCKIFSIDTYVINNLFLYIDAKEIDELRKIAEKYNIKLLLLENNTRNDLLIANSLVITEDYGIYAINNT